MQATRYDTKMDPRSHLNWKREVPTSANTISPSQSMGTVYLIDDDLRMHETVAELLTSVNVTVVSFKSAADYLEHGKPGEPNCLIVDMQLSNIDGESLQRETSPPIIFVTGQPDVPATVRAMKAGAIEILTELLIPLHWSTRCTRPSVKIESYGPGERNWLSCNSVFPS